MKIQVEKVATLAGHKDCIYTLEGCNQSNLFFSAGGDGMVVQWNLEAPDLGKMIVKVPSSVYALCYIKEYNQLVVGQNFEGIHVIDLNTNEEIRSLNTGNSAIFDIKYHDDRLYLAHGNGLVSIFNYPRLETLNKIVLTDKSARSISINYPCKEFAVGYSDNFIRIFDFNYQLKYEINAHENSVFDVKYSGDSKYLYSTSRDARLKRWDVFNGYSLDNMVVAHMYAINNLAFSNDSALFATGSMDKTIKIWDSTEMKLLKVVDRARHAGHATSVNKLLWTDYQNLLISCSDDKMIGVWKFNFNKN